WPSTVGFELARPIFLGAGVVALAAIIVIWLRLKPPLAPWRARASLGLRALIIVLLTAALAGFELQTTPSSQTLVVAADLSASVQTAQDTELATVRRILSLRQGDNRAGVVSFGRDPQVEVNASTEPQFSSFQSQPNPHYTDLASALQLAGSILPGDTRRHVVLVSDGRGNMGDALAEARLLHAEGVRVDTVAVNVPVGAEVLVDRLDAPRSMAAGERADAKAAIVSNTDTAATLRWYLDHTLISTVQLQLKSGETTVTQTLQPAQTGFHSVRVVIDPIIDSYAENNFGEALIQVVGPPRVLIVESVPGGGASLESALHSTGILTSTTAPALLPRSSADLAAYSSIVLVNVPASSLGLDAMALLQATTRDLGTGLVVIGGADSYGPGGYAGTTLESTLPLQILLPQNTVKPPVAVMLVLESSESNQGDQVIRGAAQAVIDQLTPRDSVGVTNGMMGTIVVPLAPLTDKAAIKKKIDSITLGDPPTYTPDLNAADQQLVKTTASLKHIIMLGDGDAPAGYQSVVEAIHAHGITVSTVAVGSDPGGAAVMQGIAGWGHGKFYQSTTIQDVPQIFLKETNESLKPWVVEGNINPRLSSLAEALPGVPLDSFPPLTGYVATTARAAADVMLKSPQGDPLLATWQYGVGRVVAWTSDAEGRWTSGLLRWPSANVFFGDMVRYSLPQLGDPALQVETQVQGDHTHLLVTAPASSGSAVSVSAVTPNLSDAALVLSSTGPGRFEGDLRTDQVGSYLLHVTDSVGGVVKHTTTIGLVVSYSPEYRNLGTDSATLSAIARAGGGTLLNDVSTVFNLPVPPVRAALPIAELLLVLAILLFPIDIALRRLVFSAEDLPVWRAALKRAPAAALPAEATVTRLRERVSDVRAARGPKTPPPAP
ncbi:MAG: VWA domain-containing protein, partial [Candidatus Dormibacteraeota bacterium]|nr:VWA domain-containing protein [Candidatus Dormibacteraeota bacterium]